MLSKQQLIDGITEINPSADLSWLMISRTANSSDIWITCN